MEIVVQVNGKLRGRIIAARRCGRRGSCARRRWPTPHVRKFVGTAAVRKVIVVRGKLVNVVV